MRTLTVTMAGLLLAGIVAGFVRSGQCGSVFQPRDSSNDVVNRMFGSPPPDCTTALDLTMPVWILIGLGGLLLVVGLIVQAGSRHTAGTHDDTP